MDRPSSATSEGLFASFENALRCLGIPSLDANTCRKFVGVRTDGASASIAARRLK